MLNALTDEEMAVVRCNAENVARRHCRIRLVRFKDCMTVWMFW